MRATAENHFHGAERLNCAQAILKTFQDHYSVSNEAITEHKKSGGGRVDGNVCGAVHAATLLEKDEAVQKRIMDSFIKAAGSHKCREIKSIKTLSCRECVGVAADLLVEHGGVETN